MKAIGTSFLRLRFRLQLPRDEFLECAIATLKPALLALNPQSAENGDYDRSALGTVVGESGLDNCSTARVLIRWTIEYRPLRRLGLKCWAKPSC